jgi:hypothetical protein
LSFILNPLENKNPLWSQKNYQNPFPSKRPTKLFFTCHPELLHHLLQKLRVAEPVEICLYFSVQGKY